MVYLTITEIHGHSIPAITQVFLPFEGKNTEREGDGGTKQVVNGIDFWTGGAPPAGFNLLGDITDHRHKTGLVGMRVEAANVSANRAHGLRGIG